MEGGLKPKGVLGKKRPKRFFLPITTACANAPKEYSFFDDEYNVVRLVPSGRVASYGAIAKYLGSGLSARMLGWIMNAAGTAEQPVPAHRVVNRIGLLSGKAYFGTPTRLQELLEAENIEVNNDAIVNFEQLFGSPAAAAELQ